MLPTSCREDSFPVYRKSCYKTLSPRYPRRAAISLEDRNAGPVGRLLRIIRTANGLSQLELAKRLDVKNTLISRLEVGDTADPEVSVLRKLVTTFPLLPSEALGLEPVDRIDLLDREVAVDYVFRYKSYARVTSPRENLLVQGAFARGYELLQEHFGERRQSTLDLLTSVNEGADLRSIASNYRNHAKELEAIAARARHLAEDLDSLASSKEAPHS